MKGLLFSTLFLILLFINEDWLSRTGTREIGCLPFALFIRSQDADSASIQSLLRAVLDLRRQLEVNHIVCITLKMDGGSGERGKSTN